LAILPKAPGESGLPAAARPFTLSWSHYVFLLGAKNPDERSFYEIEATEQNWTGRELRRQFDFGLMERRWPFTIGSPATHFGRGKDYV
jgi:hypothetical protein